MKRCRIRFLGMFFVPLILMAVLTFLLPSKTFSANENRPLAQMPIFSVSNIQTGSAQSGLSDYLGDQFPLRDFWIGGNTYIKKLFGQKLINGTYLGTDHYYFQQFTEDSYSVARMTSVFRMIDGFVRQQGVPSSVMLVPSPGTVLQNKLPAHAPYYDADLVFDTAAQLLSCPVIDLRSRLEESAFDTQLYYRTDHHWTSQGAYIAYQQYCANRGYDPGNYILEQVSDDFYGTLHAKVLDRFAEPDVICAPVALPEATIMYEDGTVEDTPYHQDKLTQKDQYTYFFGGNYGTVTIKTRAQTREKLLVIKDSFANSFVPFLFGDYSEIIMLDLRYFGGDVEDIIAKNGVTQILFLYETSNLLTDTGILRLQK